MTPPYRPNLVLRSKLHKLLQSGSSEALRDFLPGLTVAEFRAAGRLLADDLLLQVQNERFWAFFVTVVPSHPKAYLGTFLKAATKLYGADRLIFDEAALRAYAATCSPIDVRKVLEAFLPRLRAADEVTMFVNAFCDGQLQAAGAHLVKAQTPAAYYVLFLLLKTAEADEIRCYALALMRQADPLSFGLVSIVERYFGLEPLPGRFSLRLEDYELSRLDLGYDAFLKILLK